MNSEAILNTPVEQFIQPVYTSVEEEYRCARSSAGITKRNFSFLEMHGNDAPNFLQRMSTNDVVGLKLNGNCTTVLTTDKARIIDLITIFNSGDRLLLVCSDGNSTRIKEWLEKFIIMEDIQVIDVTANYSMLSVIGPQAESSFKNINKSNFVWRDPLWTLPVFNMILSREEAQVIWNNLFSRIPRIGMDAMEVLRIEEGVPHFGKELSEQINPLEAGLEKFISFTKGCYIGQEVVARLDTYKKLQKKLTGIIFSHNNLHRFDSQKLYDGELEVGCITSSTWSVSLEKQIGLGYIKTSSNGTEFVIRSNEGKESFLVKTTQLPFSI